MLPVLFWSEMGQGKTASWLVDAFHPTWNQEAQKEFENSKQVLNFLLGMEAHFQFWSLTQAYSVSLHKFGPQFPHLYNRANDTGLTARI